MKSGCQKTEKAKKLLNNQEFSVLAENERQGFIQVILRLNENIEKQNKTIETLLKKLDEVEKELSLTRAKLRLSNSNIYGRRSESLYPSEKGGPIQHYFDFDSDTPYPVKPASEETTKVSDSIKPEKSEEKKAEPVMTAVAAYTRAKTGRKPLSTDLPRIIVTHDVPEEDKICACGCQKIIMKEIGSMFILYESKAILSIIASAIVFSPSFEILSYHSSSRNCEQKIVEDFLRLL